jgi:putative FmdB family regulatory protein
MPLYEYECDACAHRFERIQKYSDPLADTCPKCGGHVRKLLSSPAFQFKGTGWYITDYAKKSSSDPGKSDGSKSDSRSSDDSSRTSDSSASSAAKTETKSESKSDSSSESKSDSKPESKTESKSDAKAESK